MQPIATKTLRNFAFALGVIVMVAIGPILITFLAYLIADANGCTLHEGYTNPCVMMGADIGEMLYNMGLTVWLSFYTFPAASLAFMVWLIVLLVHIVRRPQRPWVRGRAKRKNRRGSEANVTLKTRLIPCLDVNDGRTRAARSALGREDAQNVKLDAVRRPM